MSNAVSDTIADFQVRAKAMRTEVEAALAACTQYPADCPAKLGEAIRYSLLAPGKRLRPLLVLMAAEACGQERGKAMPAACAVEMIHTYSLIHDDLPAMDDDELRRGMPTCHIQFGEAVAILAGDALLAQAFEVLATGIQPPDIAARCVALLAQAAGPTALVGGQADDLEWEFRGGQLADLEAIHRRKTGALLSVSLVLGGTVAAAGHEPLTALGTYGRKLGLAFQIVDDLLDLQGDAEKLGKKVGKDSSRGKLTFPGLLGAEESARRAASLVDESIAALEMFGARAEPLRGLARYVLERNH